MSLTLDIAIATYGVHGIERVAAMLPAQRPGVSYVVSWQAHGEAPVPASVAARADVSIHRLDGKGLSRNRNNLLAQCSADIVLIADDDVELYPDSFEALTEVFERNPEVDLATFRSDHGDTRRFPARACRLSRKLPKGYYVASFEIAFRRQACSKLKFCTELGLNSGRMHGGEDEMFLMAAIRKGYNCHFFPITLCAHRHDSTGTKSRLTKENLRAMGCVIALTYGRGLQTLLRVPLKIWRIIAAGKASVADAVFYTVQGALEAPKLRKRNRDSLW